jgi:hypothetical protein
VDRIDVSRNELGDIILDFHIKGFFPAPQDITFGKPAIVRPILHAALRVQGIDENFLVEPNWFLVSGQPATGPDSGPILETGPRTGSLLLLSARFP